MENIDINKMSENFVKKILKKVKKENEENYEDELSRQTYLFIAEHKNNIPLATSILFTFFKHLKTTVDIYLYESIITSIIFLKSKDKKLASLLIGFFNNEYEIKQLEEYRESLIAQLKAYVKYE